MALFSSVSLMPCVWPPHHRKWWTTEDPGVSLFQQCFNSLLSYQQSWCVTVLIQRLCRETQYRIHNDHSVLEKNDEINRYENSSYLFYMISCFRIMLSVALIKNDIDELMQQNINTLDFKNFYFPCFIQWIMYKCRNELLQYIAVWMNFLNIVSTDHMVGVNQRLTWNEGGARSGNCCTGGCKLLSTFLSAH